MTRNHYCFLLLSVMLAATMACRVEAFATLPDTSAPAHNPAVATEYRLARFIAAYNTADPSRLSAFIAAEFASASLRTRAPAERAVRLVKTFALTRELRLYKIVKSDPTQVVALCESTVTGQWFRLTLNIEPQPPSAIVSQQIEFAERPAETVPNIELTDAQLRRRLQAYDRRLSDAGLFAGTVVLKHKGRIVLRDATGTVAGTSRLHRVGDRMSIASIGKMFTSVAIAQLEEAGKLSMNDRLRKLLPDYPNRDAADNITIAQLLNHTSGVAEYMDNPKYDEAKRVGKGPSRLTDFLPYFAEAPLLFRPGERNEYSNSGYLILGLIVERLTGRSFDQYVRSHIFHPSGIDYTESQAITPAGGEVMSADELSAFLTALSHSRLLGRAMTDRVLDSHLSAGTGNAYGLEVESDGLDFCGHSGGYPGVNTWAGVNRAEDYEVVVLADRDVPAALHVARTARELVSQGRHRRDDRGRPPTS